ncbi:uncharacterized protein MYCFIDRAFT_33694 [Pseudocercospora fijiensis CIRAD86]|uniref:Prokaryotic-type class I peptide chain release factors domain-containing protein n=1 Tax=Pseudocercospora fijiensis (strain CIRAD86) TaxID=383855 RepID=M3AK85_PSEFD|nr:uncharacterized protein MYCFIDRAFT_33694 [Pseudocercospora fijiensis CIRAD86]EME77867.1 hypothetical protein MYCFIDRAFT_33694 [Pseudocercospora fijiensis CIRAD86]
MLLSSSRTILPGRTGLQLTRCFATRRGGGGDVDEAELQAARKWLKALNPDTIPRELCEISFSRSSGPGGQNVNKVSSKATLRIPMSVLRQRLPRLMHPTIQSSRYHAAKSDDLVIQADDSRKQSDNVNACFRKLHDLIVQAGRDNVPGETSKEQVERVEKLQKAEAAGRRKMKEFQSKKKSARRGAGRGDD